MRREDDDCADALARLGASAKGFMHLAAAGLLAAMALSWAASWPDGSRGSAAAQPIGHFALIVLALSSFACAGWCLIRALWRPQSGEAEQTGTSPVLARLAHLVSSLVYGAWGIYVARLSAYESSQIRELRDALLTLFGEAHGLGLLAATALGLACSGVLNLARAHRQAEDG